MTVESSSSSNTSENSYVPVGQEQAVRKKNWPPCKPCIRHDIKADIPYRLQKITTLMLLHCFYVIFFLFVEFVTELIGMHVSTNSDIDEIIFCDAMFSTVWLVGWGGLSLIFYHSLYKALTHMHTGHYVFFFCGTIFEILLSILAVIGPKYSALMGFFHIVALRSEKVICFVCFLFTIAFIVNTMFLIFALVAIHGEYSRLAREKAAMGTAEGLPSEVDGRHVMYFPSDAGHSTGLKVESLTALPEDSFTVIAEWQRAAEGYVLYVENEPERAYWSTPYVEGILNNGLVNPMSQELTISRLQDGSFVFGVVDKV